MTIKNKNLIPSVESLESTQSLHDFLQKLFEQLSDGKAAPVNGLAAMKWILEQENIYQLLDKKNKELARDIWHIINQAGFNVENPPILFNEDLANASK